MSVCVFVCLCVCVCERERFTEIYRDLQRHREREIENSLTCIEVPVPATCPPTHLYGVLRANAQAPARHRPEYLDVAGARHRVWHASSRVRHKHKGRKGHKGHETRGRARFNSMSAASIRTSAALSCILGTRPTHLHGKYISVSAQTLKCGHTKQ